MAQNKKAKKIHGPPEYLVGFLQTFYKILVTHSGLELGFYDLINQHKLISFKKLASLKNCSEKLVHSWCNAALAIGQLKLETDKYSLLSWTKNYLCKDSANYLGFLLQNMEGLFFLYRTTKERFDGNFPPLKGSHAINIVKSIAPLANYLAPLLQDEIPKLKEKCELLDLGCGLGSYLVTLAKLNPQLYGTGIEGGWGSEVVNEARKYIKQNNMESRIRIVKSDILKFETEQKFDVIFMSGFIQAFQKDDVTKILKNSYNWLKDQGIIAIQDNLISENKLSPQFNVLFDFYLNLESPNAGLYSYQELYKMLEDAGFIEIKKYYILFGLGHVIAKKEI